MENVILIAESYLYFFCIYIILKTLYGYVPKTKISLIIVLLVHIELLIGSFVVRNLSYLLLFIVAVVVDVLSLMFAFRNCRIKSIVSIFLLFYCINIIISLLLIFVINELGSLAVNDFVGFSLNVIIAICVLSFVKFKRDYLRGLLQLIPLNVKRISLISFVASAFLITIILEYGTLVVISEWEISVRVVIVILIAVIGSVFPVLIANSIGKSFYNKQAKMFEEQIEVQAKHYEELANNNFELRRFKHDYKNMLIGVEKLIKDGDTDSALRLLEKESEIISSNAQNKFDTGNAIVDAILVEKQRKAETINSVITFEGAVPTEKIAPTDLCVIFGNTLDNAIEACERVASETQNVISIICKSAGKFVFINISNPITEAPELKNNSIKTSKADKSNHGFGIYSLKKSIKKYNGDVNFNCENNVFSVDLELTIPA